MRFITLLSHRFWKFGILKNETEHFDFSSTSSSFSSKSLFYREDLTATRRPWGVFPIRGLIHLYARKNEVVYSFLCSDEGLL